MTEPPKLLPCPWCGAGAFAGIYGSDIELRIGAWNRRAPDPERAAMAKVCEAAETVCRYDWSDNDEDAYSDMRRLSKAMENLERARKGER